MRLRTLLVFFASQLVAVALGAQYIAPGSSVSGSEFPDEDILRDSLEQARWRLGVFRFEPWIGVREASFVTSSETDEEDFTATFGAGLRGYLKTGRRLVWAAHAMPEYVWWESDSDKQSLNGRFGLGLFAFFNRLGLEMSVRRIEDQRFFSSEVQELTTLRTDRARLNVELELAEQFFLAANFALGEVVGEEEDSLFQSLDRETESIRLGIRYRSPRDWWASVGVEDVEEDFADTARPLSHTGQASVFGLGYESDRFRLAASLERRDLEASEGSSFVDQDITTGIVETLWGLHRSVDLFVYGRRQLGFSVQETNASILSERLGLRFDVQLRGSRLDLVAEVGEDDYQPVEGESTERLDEVTSFGATLYFKVRQAFIVKLGFNHTEYDSNLEMGPANFDRDVTEWTATIELGSLRERLRLGNDQQIW